jgi:membrane-bound ClpP family serine protease
VGEVEVQHSPRKYGVSKYGFSKFISGFFDLLTVLFLINFNSKPFHLFGLAGIISFLSGTIICLYLSVLKIQGNSIGGRPLLIFGILLIIVGIQLFTSGLIAELIVSRRKS